MDMAMPNAAVMDHLNHVTYPATKADLEAACEKMSDVDEKDKMWFTESLPDKTYNSAEEVKEALSMPLQSAAT